MGRYLLVCQCRFRDPVICDTPTSDFREGQSRHRFTADIRDNLDIYRTISLQDVENQDFSHSFSTFLAFTSAAEVSLFKFHLASKRCRNVLRMDRDARVYRRNGLAFYMMGMRQKNYYDTKN